jgi:hypothetical protein
MNTIRDEHSRDPFTAMTAAGESQAAGAGSVHPAVPPVPAGWRRLVTGLRGTWLYEVSPPGRSGVHWVAEMKLNGKLLSRRFAGELQARGWLTTVNEPRSSAAPFDLEELNGPYRTALVAALGRGFGHPI